MRGLVVTVEDVGIEVYSVSPCDRSGRRIDVQTCENVGIAQRCQHAVGEQRLKIELSDESVGERQPDRESANRLCLGDPG